jgi:hypothetical protein
MVVQSDHILVWILLEGGWFPIMVAAHDELFTSVQGELIDQVFDARHWQELIEFGGEERLLDPTDAADGRVPFTEFYDDFVPDLDQSDDDSSVSSETSVSDILSRLPTLF